MEELNKAISSKERHSDIKALKQRFEILNPKNLPEWVNIEAFALVEHHLGMWLSINDSDELQLMSPVYGFPVDHPERSGLWEPSNVELSRINDLALGSNKVFKSCDMKDSWEKVKKVFKGEPVKSQAWFSIHLLQSFLHPHVITKTRNEAQNQKAALLLALEKAQVLARELPTNLAVEWRNKTDTIEKEQGDCNPMFYSHPEAKLTNLINALKESEIKQGMLSKSVHGKTASRLFFIRSLTSSFLKQTGKPYRKVVADAVSAAFDCNLSETEIIRATKNIKLQPSNAMSSYLEEDTLKNLRIPDLLKDPFS